MRAQRLDPYTVKLACVCGYRDFQTRVERSKELNPYASIRWDDKKGVVFELERVDRERLEIITLEEISMLISSEYDLNQVLDMIVDKTAARMGVDVCSIYLLKEERLVLTASRGLDPDAVGKVRLSLGEGITGAAAAQGSYISVKNASEDPRYRYFPETKEERYSSMLSYPVCDKGEVLGVLNVQTTAARDFAEDEIYFVATVANLIRGALRLRKAF
jgi:signal transduction protein with GAF and PtsI domain